MLITLIGSFLMLALGWWYGYHLGVRHTEQRWSDAVGRVERIEALRRQAMPRTEIAYGGEGD